MPQPRQSSLSHILLPQVTPSGLISQPIVALDPQPPPSVREQRTKFLLFVKILMQHLRDTRNFYLLAKSKLLIKAIVRHHRIGDPHFADLLESIERRLRALVGEQHWRRAHLLMTYYLARGGSNKSTAKPKTPVKVETKNQVKESDEKDDADEDVVILL